MGIPNREVQSVDWDAPVCEDCLKPRSMTEERRLALAKQHLKEARRYARQMQNELQVLEERLSILEESLNEGS